jgi:rfaE bifunctional protein nucleotidyltransferase chain/domain
MLNTQTKIHGIAEWPALKRILDAERRGGRRVVFTNGCFDLLHVGHLRLLQAARAEGDVLVVGLNTDASVRRSKGPDRPLLPEAERAQVMASLSCVDLVTFFDEDTPARIIELVEPDVLVKGGDWGHGRIVGEEFVKARGGKVISWPIVEGHSTSDLIARTRRLGG